MSDPRILDRRVCMKTIAGSATGIALPMATAARRVQAAETERPPFPVIDTHMHVWSDRPRRFPFDHPYEPDFKGPPTPATVEMLLEDMNQNGVTHAILVQVIYHGWDNRYVVECMRRYSRVTQAASDDRTALQRDPVVKPARQAQPDRFRGHGLIDPTDPAAAEKLEYWVREQGLSGMRLSPIYYPGRDAWLNSKTRERSSD